MENGIIKLVGWGLHLRWFPISGEFSKLTTHISARFKSYYVLLAGHRFNPKDPIYTDIYWYTYMLITDKGGPKKAKISLSNKRVPW